MKVLKKYLIPMLLIIALTACGKDTPAEGNGESLQKSASKAELAGNNDKDDVAEAGDAELQEESQQEKETGKEENLLEKLQGDSYWVAYLKEDEIGAHEISKEGDSIDLILRENGEACFRDITDYMILNDNRLLNMTWNVTERQTIDIYLGGYEEPWMTATVDGEEMCMNYCGDTLYLKKEKLPEFAGERYSPAQLAGVWLMESGETEGDTWYAQPGHLESLVFEVMWAEDRLLLLASSERRDAQGELLQSYEKYQTTLLDEPLYSTCGNEDWSVLVGEYSELNENGYPEDVEIYVTLIDENTLLQQQYFSFDGGPGVSYQIFKRVVPYMDNVEYDAADLEGGDYECVRYTNAEGESSSYPPEMKDFYVHLDVNSGCFISWLDAETDERKSFSGTWVMGDANVINLISENYEGEADFTNSCWFAGAIHAAVPEDGYETEMYLYYDGGIIQLEHVAGSGGENFGGDEYEATMDDLEENVLEAPENTLLVIYGDGFLDMEAYFYLPVHEISTSEYSRKILITAAVDNTLFWYEDRNGETVWEQTMHAGESVILQIDVPEEAEENLWFNINDEVAYYYGIDQTSIDLDGSLYITE